MHKLLNSDYIRKNKKLPQFQYYFRKAQLAKGFLFRVYSYLYNKSSRKYGIEIPVNTQIGYGLYIGHPYCITINPNAIIGNNCNIHRGVLIGQENRGKRKGSPKIGNDVWIGINATIVGSINIGNDVLIAPNSYVNCNVPDHSVVYGNPCIIKSKENATDGYINNKWGKN